VKNPMRNRLIKLFLLPVAVFLWIIGWTLMWAGTRKEQETPAETPAERQSITIMPILPDEQEQIEARTPA
jgi:cytochrome c-type biogenesis protein CcmH/NrfF